MKLNNISLTLPNTILYEESKTKNVFQAFIPKCHSHKNIFYKRNIIIRSSKQNTQDLEITFKGTNNTNSKFITKEYKEEKNYKLFKVDFLNVKKLDFKICKNQREDNVLNKTPSFNLNQKRKNFLPLIHKQKHTDNIFQFKPNSIIPRKHRSYSGIPKLIRKNINII